MKILVIVLAIIAIFFIIENLLVLARTDKMLNGIKSFKSIVKNDGFLGFFKAIAKSFLFVARFFYHALRRIFIHKKNECYYNKIPEANENQKIQKDSTPHLAIQISGGYGDYLVLANWFDYMKKKVFALTDKIDMFYSSKSALTIFNLEEPNVKFYPESEYHSEFYPVMIHISSFPILRVENNSIKPNFSSNLNAYLKKLQQFTVENHLECEKHPRLDCIMSAKSIIAGHNRLQEPDFYNLLGITREYVYNLPVRENADEYLKSANLEKNKYILVHRGWDAAYGSKFHVKGWSLKSCNNLMAEIKHAFPKYTVVLFGADAAQAPSSVGCDLNLIGKTSMEQVKVLLKYAAALVDNEGGMVHLRHALHGGSSVVLFGATSPDLFGYDENINLASKVCKHWCEWLSEDWTSVCLKTGKQEAACMEAIKTQNVIDGLKKILA